MSSSSGTTGTLAVDDVRLRFRIDGREGAPWLVFSNSLMTDLALWDGQVEIFADRFRILRYDQRGHGGSSVPDGDCTFPRLVDDLAALLDHVGASTATVVGISMGGVTALGLAARYGERVGRVAICDCQVRSTPAGAAAWDERIAIAKADGMAALVEPTVRRWFTGPTVESGLPGLAPVRRMIQDTPVDGFIRAARALQSYDFGPYPAALRCPALFLVGEADATLPEAMRGMADAAPDARYGSIAGAGHLPNVERPEAFNTALSDFLTQRSAGH